MTGGQGPAGPSRRCRASVPGWPAALAATGGVGPAGLIRRVRSAVSGSPRAVAWARRGPADAFELPYHPDRPRTPCRCRLAGPPAVRGRPSQWRGPSGAPADVTRLPLRTGSMARAKQAQCTRPDVDSLALQTDGLIPGVRSPGRDWRRRISPHDPQMRRLPELRSAGDRPTGHRARVPGSTVTEEPTGASPAPVSN